MAQHAHSARTYHQGLAAEDMAAARYVAMGGIVRETRWRCPEGEIDLVIDTPDAVIFVEVKARRGHDRAAVTARQWARIGAAATRYLAENTDGARPCRFDLVLVDRMGRIECIENARSFDDW